VIHLPFKHCHVLKKEKKKQGKGREGKLDPIANFAVFPDSPKEKFDSPSGAVVHSPSETEQPCGNARSSTAQANKP
jgi:hypothetical protein